ncbi:hypothetical protein SFC27_00090 [Bacillus licheniformis]|uniref:hypothetical protein n=1 Tax=Bacillus TaxID=1386 RepID=UPI000B1A4B99|nr:MULTISPECIES: hypothetical protein [Bacillus subtilis group]MBU8739718.1 hypothetical protein [Bacillus licheniformis]MCD2486851.1 hypothetical protein [Bacillus licheniformis]MCV9371167.1 hypothetical protein [Bacillus paralicheniformis]MCY7954777.1 hypothetical protein [Bacillus licheniformis]MCY9220611.1 hypothetical protein [Bacillus licheniformis]
MAKLTEEEKTHLRKVFEKLIEQDCVYFSVDTNVREFGERDTTLTLRSEEA